MTNVSSQARVGARKQRTAAYIGASVAPASWTAVAPGVAAPNGQVYVTDGAGRYALNISGQYMTKAA